MQKLIYKNTNKKVEYKILRVLSLLASPRTSSTSLNRSPPLPPTTLVTPPVNIFILIVVIVVIVIIPINVILIVVILPPLPPTTIVTLPVNVITAIIAMIVIVAICIPLFLQPQVSLLTVNIVIVVISITFACIINDQVEELHGGGKRYSCGDLGGQVYIEEYLVIPGNTW